MKEHSHSNRPHPVKSRVNVVDILMVLLLLGLCFALVWFGILNRSLHREAPLTSAVILLEIPDQDPVLASSLTVGQTLYDIESGAAIGTVVEIASKPYLYEGVLTIDPETQVGEVQRYPHPDHLTLTVTVSAAVSDFGGRQTAGGVAIFNGSKLSLHSPTLRFAATCLSILPAA